MDINGIQFDLPKPWQGHQFSVNSLGRRSFLVGPNGSGKSRFAKELSRHLTRCRLLGTDRLNGMSESEGFGIFGDQFKDGLAKQYFQHFKKAGKSLGSGIDTFIILEERLDIRVQIEATLSEVFNREISLEWNSGNLVPKARIEASLTSYRVDREECHGIKELLVLLTHLYHDEYDWLIIDEPELNLHPQLQSFFLQEARRISDLEAGEKQAKHIIIITHSPFALDIQDEEDLASVFSFDLMHQSAPRTLRNWEKANLAHIAEILPRLTVHHRQLFFSDCPIFVEGTLDAQIVEAIQRSRQVSIVAAGSCVIDVGGSDQLHKYVDLCRALNKPAYFVYDLDSLFLGRLRQCISNDGTVQGFLAELGLGQDFSRYCGELDRILNESIEQVRKHEGEQLEELQAFFYDLAKNGPLRDRKLARARVALLIELARRPKEIIEVVGDFKAADIKGRLQRIFDILKEKNVYVLSSGTLENYLPSFHGNVFKPSEESKRNAVSAELTYLVKPKTAEELKERYGGLFEIIENLPSKKPIDLDYTLRGYFAEYVYQLQTMFLRNSYWTADNFNQQFNTTSTGLGQLFQVVSFERRSDTQFEATVKVPDKNGPRIAKVTNLTNAGMRDFTFEVVG